MPNLPVGVQLGQVTWLTASTDVRSASELEGLTGTVTLTLNIDRLPITNGPTLFVQPSVFEVGEDGMLRDNGSETCRVIATGSPAFAGIIGLQYRVDLAMSDGKVRAPLYLTVDPDQTVDITTAVPVGNAEAFIVTKGDKGDDGDPASVTAEAVSAVLPSRLSDEGLRADFGAVVTPERHGAPISYASGHDDSAAVQGAIDEAVATGLPLLFSRVYNIDGPVAAAGRLLAMGRGAHDNAGALVTGLLMQADAADGLTLSGANGSVLRDFGIRSAIATPTGGAALRFTGTGAADFARLADLAILNAYDALVVEDGTYYKLRGVDVYDPVRYGMRFLTDSGERFDHGDQTISGCTIAPMFVAGRSGGTAVRWESGGGLRFTDNKINGMEQPFQPGAGRFLNGLDLVVRDGGATSVLLVLGNSIEACTGTAVQVRQADTTGGFSKISIVGNELNAGGAGVVLSSSGPATNASIGTATITGNVFTAFFNSIAVNNVSNVHIGGNVHQGIGGPIVALNGTNADLHMDPQVVQGENKTLWYDEDAVTNRDGHGPYATARFVLEREVPVTDSSTTYSHLYRLSVPPYSAGVIEINVGGVVVNAGGAAYQGKFTYLRDGSAPVTVTPVGEAVSAGIDIDVLLDTATTTGDILVGIRLVGESGGTDVAGRASVVVNGPLFQIVKGS